MSKYIKNIKNFSVCLLSENNLSINFKPKEMRLYSDVVIDDTTNNNYNYNLFSQYIANDILTIITIPDSSNYIDNIFAMTQDPIPYNGNDGSASYNAGDISNCFTYIPLNVKWEMSTDGWFFSTTLGRGVPFGTPGGWQPATFIEQNPNLGGPTTFFDGSTLDPFWNSSFSIPCPEPPTALTVKIAHLEIGATNFATNFVPNFIRAIVTKPDNSTAIFQSPINIGTLSATVSGADVTLTASGFTCAEGYSLMYNLQPSNTITGLSDSNFLNSDNTGNNQNIVINSSGNYYIVAYINMVDTNRNIISTLAYTPPNTLTTTVPILTVGTINQSLSVDTSTWAFSGWVSNSSHYSLEYVVDTGWPNQTVSSSTRLTSISTDPSIQYIYPTSSGNGPFYATAWVSYTTNINTPVSTITYNAITL